MIVCNACGQGSPDGSRFCQGCGAPLAAEGVAQQQYAPGPAQQAPQQPYGYGQQPQPQPQQPQPQPQQPIYAKGCCGEAWDDIRSTEGWVKKLLLLTLVGFVPILNWSVVGYVLNWSKELVNGRRTTMPDFKVEGNFQKGFLCWAISILAALVLGCVAGILALVPIAGWLANLVLSVFGSMFLAVMVMRMNVFEKFGAGWELKDVWDAFKVKLGTLWCVMWLPQIVIGAVCSLIIMLLVVLAAAAGLVSTAGLLGMALPRMSTHLASSSAVPFALGLGMSEFIILVVLLILIMAFTLITVICYRALGYWAVRYVPGWAGQAAAQAAAAQAAAAQAVGVQYAAPQNPQYAAPQNPQYVAPQNPQYVAPQNPQYAPPQPTPAPQPAPVPQPPVSCAAPASEFPSDDRTVLVAAKRLVLVTADGRRLELDAFPAVLGKGSAATCIIPGDESISRTHAQIFQTGVDTYVVEDLGSTNKTLLNGRVLTPGERVALCAGDQLKLGSTLLSVVVEAG